MRERERERERGEDKKQKQKRLLHSYELEKKESAPPPSPPPVSLSLSLSLFNMVELLLSYHWLIKLLAISFLALVLLLKIAVLLWWRPRRIEHHFAKQGIRGPPYRFFIGNVKELVEMMLKASSQPMPFSHNILPRVLSFYHHWKKIYGTSTS